MHYHPDNALQTKNRKGARHFITVIAPFCLLFFFVADNICLYEVASFNNA